MSDWIEHDGKKYYEESYLILANENTKRSRASAAAGIIERDDLRAQLAAFKDPKFERLMADLRERVDEDRRLRADLKAAQAKVEEHQRWLEADSQHAENQRLRAELSEALKDKARLDWWFEHSTASLSQDPDGKFAIFQYNGDGRKYCDTPRAAMDDAIQHEATGGER